MKLLLILQREREVTKKGFEGIEVTAISVKTERLRATILRTALHNLLGSQSMRLVPALLIVLSTKTAKSL